MAQAHDTGPIGTFVRVDLIGSLAGLAFVVVANAAFVREPGVWWVMPFLVALVSALVVADRSMPGKPRRALVLVAAGNWTVAVGVSALFPFLWPVMILTVLLPLVLATPYLDERSIRVAAVAAASTSALVSAIGLLGDGGGVVADIDETFEFLLVIGALGALTLPIGLVIGQNNALQRTAIDDLAVSRRRIAEAADLERRRIERDLHDGAQQRLLALGMRLRLLRDGAAEPLAAQVGALEHEVDSALVELRELAHGIYPPLLQARGLSESLVAMARTSLLDVDATVDGVERAPAAVETALYFTAREALTNVAKHAPDARVSLALHDRGGLLELVVADDGAGFDVDRIGATLGLTSMSDRISAVSGRFEVASDTAGTMIVATVPVGDIPPG